MEEIDIYASTHGGGAFYPFAPWRNRNISLEKLIYPLGHICRFNGHTYRRVTVMEHVLRGLHFMQCNQMDFATQINWLLHDAHEGIMGDIPTPIGYALGHAAVKRLKNAIQNEVRRITDAPKITEQDQAEINYVDAYMLLTERNTFVTPEPDGTWGDGWPDSQNFGVLVLPPFPVILHQRYGINSWSPRELENITAQEWLGMFLTCYDDLKREFRAEILE